MGDECIRIVLNPAFGQFLKKLGNDMPVWIVQSAENSAVVAELWEMGGMNLTSFQQQPIAQLLWAIDEHHPGWRKLEFHGNDLGEARQAVTNEFGEGSFEPFGAGFIFERRPPGSP